MQQLPPFKFMVSSMVIAGVACASPSAAATISRHEFGRLADGRAVEAFELRAANGVSATVITYGATLQALRAPDRRGHIADIVLGYDTARAFEDHPNYFGVTVGRYANRIAGGRFSLEGRAYQLPLNNGPNSLHGGTTGFDKQLWQVISVTQGPRPSVTLGLVSPDGDQGYPGTLVTRVTYALDDRGALEITFRGETDKPTVVNMTNHAIFNLAGEGAPGGILRHRLTIPAARYTPVRSDLIPNGDLSPVKGTPFDFTTPRIIEDGIREGRDTQIVFGRGYDHNFVLDKGLTGEPRLAARLEDPASGRVLEVLTTEPGVQVYSGNFLDGTLVGKHGHLYRMGDGIALEPQKFPDTPNQPAFGSARVDPGKPYLHRMIYRVSVAPAAPAKRR